MADFISGVSEDELVERYGLSNKSGWNMDRARNAVRKSGISKSNLYSYLYRPFDERLIYLDKAIVGRDRLDVMQHVLAGDNLALCTNRQVNGLFRHALCTEVMINDCALSLESRERTYLFPIYLYPESGKKDLFEKERDDAISNRRPNLSSEFIGDFAARLKMAFIPDGKGDRVKTCGPEDVFDYMYAVFHSPTYRSRYSEFLKGDFPRLPLTSNAELFRNLCALGSELVALHLMEKHAPTITTYPIAGDNGVEKVRYTAPGEGGSEQGRVWINREQYFEGVPPEVWNFHVGGYQVCQKWLKDRKGRKLTYDDLTHYQHIVSALNETIRLMSEIDSVIEAHGGWPIT
jgi:predicted helicase